MLPLPVNRVSPQIYSVNKTLIFYALGALCQTPMPYNPIAVAHFLQRPDSSCCVSTQRYCSWMAVMP